MRLVGIPWIDTLVVAAIVVTAIATLAVKPGIAAWRMARRVSRFLDQWEGTQERADVPERDRRPGIPDRLTDLEHQVGPLTERLDAVEQRLGNDVA
ncbi:hypothetical protein H0B56_12055 [Haloechinothrix sp. YIM 98757]|uniref:Uncharacterized protein n=1 Tax=Haloechinothrix aidingensis TaxID=2752311 RepID=A0A838AAL9_9PSEU|nr:hypothetical protein [Haloechinothrix aidingensis]MBA0126275.1 hypothetical protein [Haloechinothrix aidingensis]